MTNLRPFTVILLSAACGFEPLRGEPSVLPVSVRSEPLSAFATIENNLPSDGCSFPITVSETTYAASPATVERVQSFAGRRGTTHAFMTYRLTGGTASVQCGRKSTLLPEIEVLSLSAPTHSPVTSLATITNALPSDGCSYPIEVSSSRFAPSAASVALVRTFVGERTGTLRATITYRVTGNTGRVQCGWGSTSELPEIEVLSLSAATSTSSAIITNGLPYDGCSYPVKIGSVEYAPSPSSRARVAQFASRVGDSVATIDYLVSGKLGEIQCGWSSTRALPEIEVTAIRP